ncbi:MAG TPA: ribosome small subunit-dependent GTPase A [Vicinamibacteria bacterium]
MIELEPYGWSPFFAEAFLAHAGPGRVPARVVAVFSQFCRVRAPEGELLAEVSGRFRHESSGAADFPVVGDWVVAAPRPGEERATLHAVLPRRGRLARKAAGETTNEQVLAANVDTLFLMAGLDGDFNLRRLERALVLAWDSGAEPVLVLSKADLCADVSARVAEVQALAPSAGVVALSAKAGSGLEALEPWLRPGRTVALIGSSGVGKSTLLNRLLGAEVQPTKEVRASDDRGRHTTTHRELFVLPGGALVVDTPGIREIQLWAEEEDLDRTFADVVELGQGCRFGNCRHEAEPGCGVRAALASGALSEERFAAYRKLEKELAHLERQQDQRKALEQKAKWKAIHKAQRKNSQRGD